MSIKRHFWVTILEGWGKLPYILFLKKFPLFPELFLVRLSFMLNNLVPDYINSQKSKNMKRKGTGQYLSPV